MTTPAPPDVAELQQDLADALVARDARTRADALREAAADLESQYPDVGIGSRETLRVARWLRARAGAVHQDGQP